VKPLAQEKSWEKDPGLWVIFFLYLLVAALTFNRGLFLSDEGYQLYYSWLLTRGQRIYKDFFLTVAPFNYLVQALLLEIFGPKLLVSRLYSALIGLAGFFSLAYISRKIIPGRYWLCSAGLCIIFSPNLFNFAQHAVMSKYYMVFSLALALVWLERGSLLAFFASGICAGIAGFSYQSLVAVAAAELCLGLWLRDRNKSRGWLGPALAFGAGFGLVALGVFIYLAEARLLEESFSLLVLGNRKKHVFDVFFRYILPAMALIAFLHIAPARLYFQKPRNRLIMAMVCQVVFIGFLVLALFRAGSNFFLASNMLSWVVPAALFASAFAFLLKQPRDHFRLFVFGTSICLFLAGLLGGYDIGHNLSSSLLLIPWFGFLCERIFRSGLKKLLLENALLPLLLLLMLLGLGTMLFWRWELWGEVEPLHRCTARLSLATARGIYTSPRQKRELEEVVSFIQNNSRAGDRILVYPNQLLIYFLAERVSLSRAPFFYYETTNLGELVKAAEAAGRSQGVVVLQLKQGKIFQPLESPQAELIIRELSQACAHRLELEDYLLCAL
jgi:hypothetical protein